MNLPGIGESIKAQIMQITQELLEHGADPEIANAAGTKFSESNFFAENAAIFKECIQEYQNRLQITTLYNQLKQALETGDIDTVKTLTYFNCFLENDQLNLKRYLEHLNTGGLRSEVWDNLLIYEGINYIIDENGMRVLQDLIAKFLNSESEVPQKIFENIIYFIRNSGPEELNKANQDVNNDTSLNMAVQIVETWDEKYNDYYKNGLIDIIEQLLQFGADSSIPNNKGIAFKQTGFFKANQEQLEGIEKRYDLVLEIKKACETKDIIALRQLTRFDNFLENEDILQVSAYLDHLAVLGIPFEMLDAIGDDSGINYQDPIGKRYLHTSYRHWLNPQYNLLDLQRGYEIISTLIKKFSKEELNKIEEGQGTLLNFAINELKSDSYFTTVKSRLIQSFIEDLIQQGADIEMISEENREFLQNHNNQLMIDNDSDQKVDEFNNTTSLGRSRSAKKQSPTKSFVKKHGKIGLLSVASITIVAYISYKMLSNGNQSFSRDVTVALRKE